MNNEYAVREALQELTLDQPAAPVDRVVGVRRRHIRRRSMQGATTVVAAAAAVLGVLLGVGVLTGGSTTTPKSLQQPARSWQLPWPDRSQAEGAAVKAQALGFLGIRAPRLRDARWLYAGKLQTRVSWAVLEATEGGVDGAHHLIALSSTNNGKTDAEAPSASTQQIGFGRYGDRWVLILTAPGTDQVGMSDLSSGTAQVLPTVDTTDGVTLDHLRLAPIHDALLVGSSDLTSTFVVRLPDSGGPGATRLPAWELELLSHAPPVRGYRKLSGVAGATPSTDGATITNYRHYSGPMIEVIRCAGQAPLTFSMAASGRTTSKRIERCDGQSLTLHLGSLGHDGKYTYTISGDPSGVYAVAVYVQKAK
jgi:hypothetical protein